jgi:hypothetical protein
LFLAKISEVCPVQELINPTKSVIPCVFMQTAMGFACGSLPGSTCSPTSPNAGLQCKIPTNLYIACALFFAYIRYYIYSYRSHRALIAYLVCSLLVLITVAQVADRLYYTRPDLLQLARNTIDYLRVSHFVLSSLFSVLPAPGARFWKSHNLSVSSAIS